jgi:hypothetical protein
MESLPNEVGDKLKWILAIARVWRPRSRLVPSGFMRRRLRRAEALAAIRQIFVLRQGGAPAVDAYFAKLRDIEGYPRPSTGTSPPSPPAIAPTRPTCGFPRSSFLGSKSDRTRGGRGRAITLIP